MRVQQGAGGGAGCTRPCQPQRAPNGRLQGRDHGLAHHLLQSGEDVRRPHPRAADEDAVCVRTVYQTRHEFQGLILGNVLDAPQLVQAAHVHDINAVTLEECRESLVQLVHVRRKHCGAGDTELVKRIRRRGGRRGGSEAGLRVDANADVRVSSDPSNVARGGARIADRLRAERN